MYQKYENMIKALTRDYFPVKEDAEDAAQEIAIKLLTMKDSPPQDNEAGWMYVVIDNACKDIYRAAKRRQGAINIAFDSPCGTWKWAPMGRLMPCTSVTDALLMPTPAS